MNTESAASALRDLQHYYKNRDLSGAWTLSSLNDAPVEGLARKIRAKMDGKEEDRKFVVAAMGTFLVGGLGSCHVSGYVGVMAEVISRAFQAAGVPVEIRTVSFGANCGSSARTSGACVDALLGDDVDVLQYSFPHGDDEPQFRADLAKWTNGSVLVLEAVCRDDELLKGKNHLLLRDYGGLGSDVLCLHNALGNVLGKSVYLGNAWGQQGDGLHLNTRDSATASMASSKILWRNWLPGPLGHQFIADAVSHLLLRALVLAPTIQSSSVAGPSRETVSTCWAPHEPSFSSPKSLNKIKLESMGDWKMEGIPAASEDDVPTEDALFTGCQHPDKCRYLIAFGSTAGPLVFSIAENVNLPKRKVYLCCCCNHELCVEEQLKFSVNVAWEQPVGDVMVENAENADATEKQVGRECLLVANDMPFANKMTLTVKPLNPQVPIKLSRVVVV